MEIKQFERDGQSWFLVDGKEMPLYLENGEINQELQDILNTEKENQGEKVVVVAKPEKFAKTKMVLKKNKRRIIAGGLAILVLGGIILLCKSCDSKNNANTEIVEVVDEEYSRELLNTRIKSFTKKANERGITVKEEEIRDFASFINIDRVINEDPELAKELFDGKNAQDVLSNVGHMIGVLMTNSHKGNYKTPMNLSELVVGSNYDKQILEKLESYRDELTTMRAEEDGMHRVNFETEEEDTKFNEIITDVLNFYSMTTDGLETKFDSNSVIQKMGDGSRFATVLVMNEINIGNNNLLSKEQTKAFNDLMSNEAVVSNLQNMIEGCQTVELEQQKVKTK